MRERESVLTFLLTMFMAVAVTVAILPGCVSDEDDDFSADSGSSDSSGTSGSSGASGSSGSVSGSSNSVSGVTGTSNKIISSSSRNVVGGAKD